MTNMSTSSSVRTHSSGGSVQCKTIALSIVDDFSAQLIALIESTPQGVSVTDIRAFVDRYKSEHINNNDAEFKAHFQSCLTRCEQEIFDPATRREPFKRVLTSRFVDLFPPLNGMDDHGTYLSRRLLPGLFLAFEKMVGDEAFHQGHKLCKDLVDVLKNTHQGFVWEDLYLSDEAQDTVDDLLMSLLPHFSDPMKRVTWMLNLINNDLADPADYHFEGPANRDWLLDEGGMILLLRRLFGPLKHQLTDKDHAMALAAKYGAEKTRALLALVNVLDQAEAQT